MTRSRILLAGGPLVLVGMSALSRVAFGQECAAPTCAVPYQGSVCNLYQHPGCYAPETPYQAPYQAPVTQSPPTSQPPAAAPPSEPQYYYVQQAYTVPEQVMMPMTMMVPQTVYRQRTFMQRVASGPEAQYSAPAAGLSEPLSLPVANAPVASAPTAYAPPAYAPPAYAPAAPNCSGSSRITEMLVAHMLNNASGGGSGSRTASSLDSGSNAELQTRINRLEERINRLIQLMEQQEANR